MRAIILTKAGDLAKIQAWIDNRLGYPKAGVNIGGGVHAPPGQSITLHAGRAIPHPTQAGQFAHHWPAAFDAHLAAIRAAFPNITIPDPVELDATWEPKAPASAP